MMKKKILIILNYYYPYVSGVSEYARIIAEKFVQKGHDVTVLTSNHANLQSNEVINGVNVIRTKVLLKISKGTISPQFITKAIKLSKKFDVINLHMPMLESGLISMFIKNRNIIATYQCDINLPKSFFNSFVVRVMDFSNNLCLRNARKIVVLSYDYANQSRIAKKYKNKLLECPAPIKNYSRVEVKRDSSVKRIGFCGRIVEEKGINVLMEAFALLQKERNDIALIIGGDYKNIAGGSVYPELMKYVKSHNLDNVQFLGKIPEENMAEFYSSLDVMTLPSINTLEAFGMVQVEAMFCGTPVVASDLPGVRTIVQNTGMGEIAKRNNAKDLAEKIALVLESPQKYIKSKKEIEKLYGMQHVYNIYMNAYQNKV